MTSENIRRKILAHGKTVQTRTGPVYVGCNCARCILLRERMGKIRMQLLDARRPPAG